MIYHRTFNTLCDNLNVEISKMFESSLPRQESVPKIQTCTCKVA